MVRHLKIISIFLLLFLIFLPSLALAQTAVGKFTFVQGRVDVLRQSAPRAVPVNMGDAVFVGDIIRAKSKSKAEITFTDGNIVRVAPNTRVEISEYMFDEAKGKGILKLSRGKVQAIIQEKIAKRIATFGEANRFEIHTPTAILGVRGTNFIVSHHRNSSSVLVLEGAVFAYSLKYPDLVVTVNAGYIAIIPFGQPVQPARPFTDAEKKMYEGDFSPTVGAGEKSEAEDTVISEATTGSVEPGAPESGPESPTPMGTLTETPQNLTEIVQPPPITETVGSDTTSPELSITTPTAPMVIGQGDITIDIEASETGITYSYKLNTEDWNTTNELPIIIPKGMQKEGINTLEVKATDAANNTSKPISYQWFVGNTKYSLEGNVTGSLSGSVLSTSEGLRVVSNGSQGAWLLHYSGNGAILNKPKLISGGKSYGPNSEKFDGYWLSKIEDATASNGSISGTSSFKYLSNSVLGLGTGSVSGTYGSPWQVTDLGLGTYTESTLTFGGNIGSEVFEWDPIYYLVGVRSLTGQMGIAEIEGSLSFLSLDTYNTDYETNNLYDGALWGVDIVDSTPDNGALLGITGGIVLDDNLEGGIYSIYIRPDGETGYIFSDAVNGTLYPGLGMYELNSNLISISMGTTEVSPSALNWDNLYGDNPSLRFGKEIGTIEGDVEGSVAMQNIGLIDEDWGIWWGSGGGTFNMEEPPSTDWTANASGESYGFVYGEEGGYWDMVGYWGGRTIGKEWANGVLKGFNLGYWANTLPATGISVGETLGTFDPNAYTWQAVSMGAWIETSKFLQMTTTPGGIAKLQKLNIPCVEVGRTNLSGALLANGDHVSVLMNDAIFFAPNAGQKPSIWATNNVSGQYNFSTPGQIGGKSITNPANSFVVSNGGNISATYQFNQWGNNKWLGTVSNGNAPGGIGSYKGSFKFNGAAAGTFSGANSGSLSGTAAGIAK